MFFCMTVAEPDPEADAVLEASIARIAGGDQEALADLYGRTRSAIYGFALSIVKNAHDAEDILHDAYLQVWNAAGGYRAQGKPMAWLLTITRNLALSRLREHGGTEPLVQEDWQDRLADAPAVTHEDRMALEALLSALGEEGRQMVTLRALTGLKEGTLVAAGCGDSAASSFGAGVIRPGMIYDVAGTASIFSVSTCQFNPDEEHKTILAARSVVDRLYIPHAYLSGGGLCVRWMRQIADKSYDEMEEMASKAAGEISDLFFIPHFSGRTCPNEPNVRGGFTGLSWSHTAGHLYRAVLESIALEYNEYFGILKEREPDLRPDGIYGVGGGTKCDLFNQIKADVLGIPYHTLQIEEAGTYGLAVLAGYAAGLYPDLLESGRHIRIHGSYQPDARQFAGYQNKTGQYSRLLKNCRNGLDIE